MERLPQRDVRALLQVTQDVHGVADHGTFVQYVIDRLPTLVAVDSISYSELRPTGDLLSTVRSAPSNGIDLDRLKPLFRQHPLVAYFRGWRDPQWLRTSDVISPTRWHGLPIYNEYYRAAGIDHQL